MFRPLACINSEYFLHLLVIKISEIFCHGMSLEKNLIGKWGLEPASQIQSTTLLSTRPSPSPKKEAYTSFFYIYLIC